MDRVSFLRSTELFARLPQALIEQIAASMTECRATPGEFIFREGEFGDAAYLIVDGSLELRVGGTTLVSRKRGECVGEFALMDNAPRSASAIAESSVCLLKWSGADFDRALREDISRELQTAVLRMLTTKLRENVTRQPVSSVDRDGEGNLERFSKVNAVFQAALACKSEERGALLEQACAGDPELIAEANALLASHKEMGDFLEWYMPESEACRHLAADPEFEALPDGSEPGLAPGRLLGGYEITSCLAAGGMAQVYEARDRRLGRRVALKVLPPALAVSPKLRRRLEREARIVARLNHPNIVTLYSAEEVEGLYFITMELVDGQTLSNRIPTGGMAVDDFFQIAAPVVCAVAAAHDKGVTHRDLKPDNIMITDEGRVKVLDFGLAKAKPPFEAGWEHRDLFKTQRGYILGTIPYMSPEQAEGKAVDERSDIFSIGIVFYEMLTGQTPFGGDSTTAILSSILRDTPLPVRRFNPDVPDELEHVISRCLKKNLSDRYQRAIELMDDLESISSHRL